MGGGKKPPPEYFERKKMHCYKFLYVRQLKGKMMGDTMDGVIEGKEVKFVYCPLDWQKRGLRQTVSGYGAKLTSAYKAPFNGRLYRIYHTIFSNIGTAWITVKGQKIIVK